MKISYIGGGPRLESCCKFFENRCDFEHVGFFCNPLEACIQTASKYNGEIYTDTDSLCKNAQIILIATEDNMLPLVIHTLSRLHISGKIIISVAEGISARDLDTGYENTYVALTPPTAFENMNDKELSEGCAVCEGYGAQYDELCEAFKNSDMNVTALTPAQMKLYRANMHLLKSGILALTLTATKLSNMITGDKQHSITPAVRYAIKNASSGKDAIAEPYKTGKPGYVKELIKIFENNGIDSIAQLYGSVAKVLVENSDMEYDVADDIYRMLRMINR